MPLSAQTQLRNWIFLSEKKMAGVMSEGLSPSWLGLEPAFGVKPLDFEVF